MAASGTVMTPILLLRVGLYRVVQSDPPDSAVVFLMMMTSTDVLNLHGLRYPAISM